jgi:putative tryptophan/tyrosine transport system substrate-binding protein
MIARRDFIGLFGGLFAAWPCAAEALLSGRIPTIAYLGPSTPALDSYRLPAFIQRLRELGWIQGRTVAIEYRWAEGRDDHLAQIAAEFVRRRVDVIVTSATPPSLAMKRATSTIPIVFVTVGDPVGTGLVASLARPGGNVTGLWQEETYAAGKRVEMLREIIPNLRHLGIMANGGNPSATLQMHQVEAMTRTLGLEAVTTEIHRAEDIGPAFDALKGRVQALYVCNDPLAATNRVRINTLALGIRLPTMFMGREYVGAGGLISYGPNFADLYRRTAELVDKILRGAKPGDIPVERPTKFDLVVSLTTARALGLTIPKSFLQRADEVID